MPFKNITLFHVHGKQLSFKDNIAYLYLQLSQPKFYNIEYVGSVQKFLGQADCKNVMGNQFDQDLIDKSEAK